MSLSICVLGSGSAGNCTVLMCQESAAPFCMLIDAGLSPRATARRLRPLGVHVDQLRIILLTHLDSDHFHGGWLKAIAKHNLDLRIYVHKRHARAAWACGMSMRNVELFGDSICFNDCAKAHAVMLAHDDLGSVGFVIEHAGLRLGYATDLGRVTDGLIEQFVELDVLAIESNYDRQMQLSSGRPWFLKRRIMGGVGHLSNEQAFEAVQRIDASSRLAHIALLHLSRQCNDPELVRTLYQRRAPHLVERLTITNQYRPTALLHVDSSRVVHKRTHPAPTMGSWIPGSWQMSLFDGFAVPS